MSTTLLSPSHNTHSHSDTAVNNVLSTLTQLQQQLHHLTHTTDSPLPPWLSKELSVYNIQTQALVHRIRARTQNNSEEQPLSPANKLPTLSSPPRHAHSWLTLESKQQESHDTHSHARARSPQRSTSRSPTRSPTRHIDSTTAALQSPTVKSIVKSKSLPAQSVFTPYLPSAVLSPAHAGIPSLDVRYSYSPYKTAKQVKSPVTYDRDRIPQSLKPLSSPLVFFPTQSEVDAKKAAAEQAAEPVAVSSLGTTAANIATLILQGQDPTAVLHKRSASDDSYANVADATAQAADLARLNPEQLMKTVHEVLKNRKVKSEQSRYLTSLLITHPETRSLKIQRATRDREDRVSKEKQAKQVEAQQRHKVKTEKLSANKPPIELRKPFPFDRLHSSSMSDIAEHEQLDEFDYLHLADSAQSYVANNTTQGPPATASSYLIAAHLPYATMDAATATLSQTGSS